MNISYLLEDLPLSQVVERFDQKRRVTNAPKLCAMINTFLFFRRSGKFEQVAKRESRS
jgi:hypothetical protein